MIINGSIRMPLQIILSYIQFNLQLIDSKNGVQIVSLELII